MTIRMPDQFLTGEIIKTPRGSFHVTSLSVEDMKALGYGTHHVSEDSKFLIMGNGIRAFAVENNLKEGENVF